MSTTNSQIIILQVYPKLQDPLYFSKRLDRPESMILRQRSISWPDRNHNLQTWNIHHTIHTKQKTPINLCNLQLKDLLLLFMLQCVEKCKENRKQKHEYVTCCFCSCSFLIDIGEEQNFCRIVYSKRLGNFNVTCCFFLIPAPKKKEVKGAQKDH